MDEWEIENIFEVYLALMLSLESESLALVPGHENSPRYSLDIVMGKFKIEITGLDA